MTSCFSEMSEASNKEKIDLLNKKLQDEHDKKPCNCLKPPGCPCEYLKLYPEDVVPRNFLGDNEEVDDSSSDSSSVLDSYWSPWNSYLMDPSSYTWSELVAPVLSYKQSLAENGVNVAECDITREDVEYFYTYIWHSQSQ